MKSIGIFYFSGTGNTELVARLIAKALEDRGAKAELILMEDIIHGLRELHPESYDIIGLGHPVLGLGPTGIAYRFAELLPPSASQKTFVFKTAGDPVSINNGASKPIIKLLTAKGYEVFHESCLAMATNWLVKYDDRLIKQLYEAAVKKAERIAEEILSLTPRELRLSPILTGFCKFVHSLEENHGAKMFAGGFRISDTCTGCKKCITSCPVKNISEKAGRPAFGRDCIMCMRCVYSCPHNSIYNSRFPIFVLKPYNGGFNIDRILEDPSIGSDFVTASTKGFYRHFNKYFMDI